MKLILLIVLLAGALAGQATLDSTLCIPNTDGTITCPQISRKTVKAVARTATGGEMESEKPVMEVDASSLLEMLTNQRDKLQAEHKRRMDLLDKQIDAVNTTIRLVSERRESEREH